MSLLKDKITSLKEKVVNVRYAPDWSILCMLMGEYSEDRWCAGWLMGLEYILWDYLMKSEEPTSKEDGVVVSYDMFRPTPDELLQMAEIADEIGGWVIWDSSSDSGNRFVTFEEWLPMYDAWKNTHER
jgi:hypothetical protein